MKRKDHTWKSIIVVLLLLLTSVMIPTSVYGITNPTENNIQLRSSNQDPDEAAPVSPISTVFESNDFSPDSKQKKPNTITSPPSVDWITTIGGNFTDTGTTVKQTRDEGFIITGWTKSYSTGYSDLWLVKVNKLGVEEWNQSYGYPSTSEWGEDVIQTDDGGFIILGTVNANPFSTTSGDMWLIKTNETGGLEWSKIYGIQQGYKVEYGREFKKTSDNGYIIVSDRRDFYTGRDWDIWVIKTDENGTIQHQNIFVGPFAEYVSSVVETTDGYLLLGYSSNFEYVFGYGFDFWLIKTDFTLQKQWQRFYGSYRSEYADCIEPTMDGGFILTGTTLTYGYLPGDRNIWLLKIDDKGNEQWNRSFGGTDKDYGHSVYSTKDKGYIISGATDSFGTFVDSREIWVVKTRANGHLDWDLTFGSSDYDSSWSIQQTKDTGYILTGRTTNPSTGQANLILIKLTADELQNTPPDEPKIEGESIGKAGVSYSYTIQTKDQEQDDIYYFIDWGDNNQSGWLGPYQSEVTLILNHTWTNKGSYEITVKAKDDYDAESNVTTQKIIMIKSHDDETCGSSPQKLSINLLKRKSNFNQIQTIQSNHLLQNQQSNNEIAEPRQTIQPTESPINDLIVHISTNKETYLHGEPVKIKLTVTNTGTTHWVLQFGTVRQLFNYQVLSSEGEDIYLLSRHLGGSPTVFTITFPAGETIGILRSDWLQINDDEELIPEGTYQLNGWMGNSWLYDDYSTNYQRIYAENNPITLKIGEEAPILLIDNIHGGISHIYADVQNIGTEYMPEVKVNFSYSGGLFRKIQGSNTTTIYRLPSDITKTATCTIPRAFGPLTVTISAAYGEEPPIVKTRHFFMLGRLIISQE